MTFLSWQYLALLVASLVAYWACVNRRVLRTWLLFGASLICYGAFESWFLWLLLFSIVLDYLVGRAIGRAATPRGKRLALYCSLGGNLGLLAYFKYSAWVAQLLAPLQLALGTHLPLRDVVWTGEVPLGISFYTFQSLSYTIDVFRGVIPPRRSLRDVALFVSFFPQIVWGPIARAREFLPQIDCKPRLDRERIHYGLWRIGTGLAKKTLLADVIGRTLVDPVYAQPEMHAAPVHVLALYAFAFQLYCTFSGYTDIAVGTARLFGYDLMENFDAPYRSLSIREFWRRWQISLSTWVRDYLFFPLGGSRCREATVTRNVIGAMVVIGLWHGASTLCLAYGLLHGAALLFERWRGRMAGGPFATTPARSLLAWVVAFHFTVLTCVFLRASDMTNAWDVLSRHGGSWEVARAGWLPLGLAVLTHFLPDGMLNAVRARVVALPTLVIGLAIGLLLGTLFVLLQGQAPAIDVQY